MHYYPMTKAVKRKAPTEAALAHYHATIASTPAPVRIVTPKRKRYHKKKGGSPLKNATR